MREREYKAKSLIGTGVLLDIYGTRDETIELVIL